MLEEEKQLLLQDLSARLPYGVKVYVGDDLAMTLRQIDYKCFCESWENEDFKSHSRWMLPYLRPISSMTDEEMDRLFDILHIDKDGKDEDWIKINDVYGIKFFFPTGKWIENVAEAYDYLYSIHIDFRGLIHKGLAIEVTEDNNPYKD